ncbi:MAG: hypothetical protein FRX49_09026 [Trebouxia sp. A1-2]|nr:MAG: hypothetical protein FRX49_09026 [Trebouxia sp. A1-2]
MVADLSPLHMMVKDNGGELLETGPGLLADPGVAASSGLPAGPEPNAVLGLCAATPGLPTGPKQSVLVQVNVGQSLETKRELCWAIFVLSAQAGCVLTLTGPASGAGMCRGRTAPNCPDALGLQVLYEGTLAATEHEPSPLPSFDGLVCHSEGSACHGAASVAQAALSAAVVGLSVAVLCWYDHYSTLGDCWMAVAHQHSWACTERLLTGRLGGPIGGMGEADGRLEEPEGILGEAIGRGWLPMGSSGEVMGKVGLQSGDRPEPPVSIGVTAVVTRDEEGWILNEAVQKEQHLVQQLQEAETEMLADAGWAGGGAMA